MKELLYFCRWFVKRYFDSEISHSLLQGSESSYDVSFCLDVSWEVAFSVGWYELPLVSFESLGDRFGEFNWIN